ncbi:2-hydroxy-acid oxidase [Dactylosporangium sp. NBC_01737]|uniref:2-hydroxy-acid oxidase n=1 Tax=Dactylosporangium sp. NBC_01737 TaxID=2975959 RepID=UPI002E14C38B|nr:2-hydroxy-acid oxidase [Dactylosporangium sp. NBC_01737]
MPAEDRWGLRRAVSRRYSSPAVLAADPDHTARLSAYLTDLVGQYGLSLTPSALDPVRGQSYGEMAVELLPDSPVDLLVLAYDVPDISPGRAVSTYLTHVCPGEPMSFAVSDQGRAAAFTALSLMRAYTATHPRALLIAVEQTDLPYDPGVPVALPAAHAGVALHLDATTAAACVSVTVTPDSDAVLDNLDASTVVLGGGLAALADDVKADLVVLADPAQPMTGVWESLAALDLGTAGRIAVADYDPALRYLCVATFG